MQIIPSADSIPVNWWWFQILLLFTFLLHIILMNMVLGGSIITLYSRLVKKKSIDPSLHLPTVIALAINFGVPPLLFIQVLYGHFFYTSSVIMAVPWILVIPVLILAYYGAYLFVYKNEKYKNTGNISLFISTILILFIAFVYVNNNTLMLRPDRWLLYFTKPGGFAWNTGDISIYPRYLHFITGAIAIAGLSMAAYAHFSRNITNEKKESQTEQGLKIFSIATMIQVLIGILFLLSLPREIMLLFLGGNFLYTLLLMAGLVVTVFLILYSIRRRFYPVLYFTITILLIMIVIRELVRHAYLGDFFSPSTLTVKTQFSPLIAFLAVFLVGVFSIYHMYKLVITKKI